MDRYTVHQSPSSPYPQRLVNSPTGGMIKVTDYPTISVAQRPHTDFPLFWFGWALLLAIALIIILFLYLRDRIVLIEPSKCPVVKYAYAVLPSTQKPTLNTCGEAGSNSPCIFPVNSLLQATQTCDSKPDCNEFTFDPNLRQMTIVDSTGPSSASNLNLFIRQLPVLVRESRVTNPVTVPQQ